MNRNLLKEAIADAKAVKETAIANAKAYLEESFTPQLRSMLAAKLEEMDEDEISEKEYKQPMTKKEKGEGDERFDDTQAEEDAEEMRKLDEDELDLDEILAQLSEKDDPLEKEVGDTEKYDYEKGKEEGEEDEADKEDDEEEDVEIDLEDMTEDDLKDFIETVIADMVEAGELEAGEGEIEGEEEVEYEEEEEIEINEDARTDAEQEGYKDGFKDAIKDIKNALKGLKVSESVLEELDKLEERGGEDIGISDEERGQYGHYEEDDLYESKKLKPALKEAYKTIKVLRSELNEINLLNAKLLYTNKIFRSKTLTETQKVKILSAFDKAGTVKEVKIVFETLNENIKAKKTKNNLKESLGFASKATGTAKKSAKPIVETDPMVERFKKLAGIK